MKGSILLVQNNINWVGPMGSPNELLSLEVLIRRGAETHFTINPMLHNGLAFGILQLIRKA